MKDFSYMRARTLGEAHDAVASGARVLSGGTELLNLLRLGAETAEAVLDISGLPGLRGIERKGAEIHIGALVTLSELEASPLVREVAPALAEACLRAASPQVRNLATIGGNILQRTRCPYYRMPAAHDSRAPCGCNKRRPGSGCSALDGVHPRGSLFGATEACVCSHPSDPVVALAMLDAEVLVSGSSGGRGLPVTDFLLSQAEAAALLASSASVAAGRGPGSEAAIVNRLGGGEIVTGYRFVIDEVGKSSAYVKVRERQSYEFAMASAAAGVSIADGRIGAARVALGSVAQKPWRLPDAERRLVGMRLDRARITLIIDEALADARPLRGQEYKVTLARNAAVRAVLSAGGAA
jgi:xanthine dehydrogenase YagS FAD-binding subunit